MQISQAGINLIKKFEGCILHPYQDQVGYWTIGYGNRYINGVEVTKDTPKLTLAQAETLLRESLKSYQDTVRKSVKVTLNQNQYDALCSFCFNLGSLKALADKINNGTISKEDFMQYVYAKGVKLPVLVSRRAQEADYYFKAI